MLTNLRMMNSNAAVVYANFGIDERDGVRLMSGDYSTSRYVASRLRCVHKITRKRYTKIHLFASASPGAHGFDQRIRLRGNADLLCTTRAQS